MQPLPQRLGSAHVVVRFCCRLLILAGFAAFGSIGFGNSLLTLLWMATVFCAVTAGARREQPLATELNHWDETAAYGALLALIHGFVR